MCIHTACLSIGFGLASHLGVECSLPCVGVAKNLFHVDGLKRDDKYKEKVWSGYTIIYMYLSNN